MEITKEMIAKYDGLVYQNAHGELLEEIAKDFKLRSYIDIFKSINTIHEIEESLMPDVLTIRTRFKTEMKGHLRHHLTSEEYESISKYI